MEPTISAAAHSGAAPPKFLGLEGLSSLRHRDFRLLWLGSFALYSTSIFQYFAIGKLIQSYFPQLLGPSFPILLMLGLAGFIRGISMLLFTVPGGALADRVDRRRLSIITQTTALILVGALSLLLAYGSVQVWQVFLLLFITSATTVFDVPARQALIPQLVEPREIPNGVALLAAATQSSLTYSALLAGYSLDILGIAGCYAISAIGNGSLLLALLLMKPVERRPSAAPSPILLQVREGFSYARSDPTIFGIMVVIFIVSALGMALVLNLTPSWMLGVMGLSSTTWGLMGTLWGVGTVVTAYVLSGSRGATSGGQFFIGSALLFAAMMAFWGLNRSVIILVILEIVAGAASGAMTISGATIIQSMVPDNLRGRVMSLFGLSQALSSIGGLFVGAFAEMVGLTTGWTLIGIALLAVVALAAAALPRLRAYSRLEPYEGQRAVVRSSE